MATTTSAHKDLSTKQDTYTYAIFNDCQTDRIYYNALEKCFEGDNKKFKTENIEYLFYKILHVLRNTPRTPATVSFLTRLQNSRTVEQFMGIVNNAILAGADLAVIK